MKVEDSGSDIMCDYVTTGSQSDDKQEEATQDISQQDVQKEPLITEIGSQNGGRPTTHAGECLHLQNQSREP